MNNEKLNHYKKLLVYEKKEIMNNIDRMKENEMDGSMREYFNELSSYDNHPADLGTEMFMTEQNMNLKKNEEDILDEIENSLIKIEKGSYGICENCHKDIDEERLKVIPHARYCIDCAEQNMQITQNSSGRPVEEDLLKTPYNRTYNEFSNKEANFFDGEDSIQAVFRFNEVPNDPSYQTGDHLGVFDEGDLGIVEDVEKISDDYYVGQLEGLNRKDIVNKKDKQK